MSETVAEMETRQPPQPVATPPVGHPIGILAELTHRCPLRCPYCSNPLELERREAELDTATWKRVLSEAAALGILHVHLSGGEPTARPDLVELTAHSPPRGSTPTSSPPASAAPPA